MNTGDWWWNEQDKLPARVSLVPFVILSDSTHLTAFVGDTKIWPVYMTIGNLSSVIRMKPTTHSVVMIAVLPGKAKYSAQSGISKQKQATWEHQIIHVSQTWRDRLLGAAASTAATLATIWLILVSAAAAAVLLRA